MKIRIACLLVLSALCCSVRSQCKVYPVRPEDSLSSKEVTRSFFYSLPMNYFKVTVTLDKTSRYPGPFAEYAERMLGLSGAIRENSIQYSIRSIDIQECSLPDTSRTYAVEYADGVYPSGAVFAGIEYPSRWNVDFSTPDAQTRAQFEIYDNYTLIEKIDTVYEDVMVDSVWTKVPKIYKKMVEKTTAQKADEALEKIKNIREAQWLLLTGDHEVDFSNLQYMISELKKEEETYLSLYSGFSVTEDEIHTFIVALPKEKSDVLLLPLFGFSEKTGLLRDAGFRKDLEVFQLKMENRHTTDALHPVLDALDRGKKKSSYGFYYRIPEYYSGSIVNRKGMVKELGDFPVSQYGLVNRLPKNLMSFELDALTGNLKFPSNQENKSSKK